MRSSLVHLIWVALLALSGRAKAEKMQTTEQVVFSRSPLSPGIDIQPENISKIIYLNRCSNGCSITPGTSDARVNTSSLVSSNSFISAWEHGDISWGAMLRCVKELYAPYDVEVTDIDPGANIPHHEAIVAGRYQEIGYERPIGGIATAQCIPSNNVISFTFANGIGDNPITICHTVGQEIAHTYGLEHLFNCADPMTYLYSCGKQFFRDVATPCGEYEVLQECLCGGNVQNSHRWLEGVLGKAKTVLRGPNVSVLEPLPDEKVQDGFFVRVNAYDSRGIGTVLVYLNGEKITEKTEVQVGSPYVFEAPANFADGVIDVEVRVANDIGTETITKYSVQKGEPCKNELSCNKGQSCKEGRCLSPTVNGQLGETCSSDATCESELCYFEDAMGYCSEVCTLSFLYNSCPEGFSCKETEVNKGVCSPINESSKCGCQSSGPSAWLGTLLLLLVLFRGRNRSSSQQNTDSLDFISS